MEFKPPGHFRSAEDFARRLAELMADLTGELQSDLNLGPNRDHDPDHGCALELRGGDGPMAQPLSVFGRRLDNRWVSQPMEGWDGQPNGAPSERTLRRWRNFGRSGAGLIWGGEAYAVRADGKASAHQLHLDPSADPAAGLSTLREEVRLGRREQALDPDSVMVGLQLTHSGRFARPSGVPAPVVAQRHPVLDARSPGPPPELVSDGELESIGKCFVAAARLAREVGFDFVDVKVCHGYLLHELLASHTREGRYGGSFDNRCRLFERIVSGIRSECPGLPVVVRLSFADVFPHRPDETGRGAPLGWQELVPYDHGFGVDRRDPRRFDLSEPIRFLERLAELGIELVNITSSSPYWAPHLQRPATYPPSDGYLPPEDPLLGVLRHLELALSAKRAVPGLTVVGSGYSYLQEWLPHVAEHEVEQGHVDLVGLGRSMLSYPELPFDHLGGRKLERKRLCRTFSDCTTAPRNGLVSGCYPLDDFYRKSAEFEQLRAVKSGSARPEQGEGP